MSKSLFLFACCLLLLTECCFCQEGGNTGWRRRPRRPHHGPPFGPDFRPPFRGHGPPFPPHEAEMLPRMVFSHLDKDNNGSLSKEEYAVSDFLLAHGFIPPSGDMVCGEYVRFYLFWLDKWISFRFLGGSATKKLHREAFRENGVEHLFSAIDGDHNGEISFSEWHKSPPQFSKMLGLPRHGLPSILLDFEPRDTNGDGLIDEQELPALVKAFDEDNDGYVSVKEHLIGLNQMTDRGRAFEWFMIADRNGNYRLDGAELTTVNRSLEKWDLDKDGVVTIVDCLLAPPHLTIEKPTPPPPPTAKASIAPTRIATSVIPIKKPTATPSASLTATKATTASTATLSVAPTKLETKKEESFGIYYALAGGLFLLLAVGLFALFVKKDVAPQEELVVADKSIIKAKSLLRSKRFDQAASLLQGLITSATGKRDDARALLVRAFIGAANLQAAKAGFEAIDTNNLETETLYHLGTLFEEAGSAGTAAHIFNLVYARDIKFKDVKERLENTTAKKTIKEVVSTEAALERLSERYKDPVKIGSGGMGVVYKVFDKVLQRDVAIKMLHPGTAEDERYRLRFMREARALARLSHPNIIPVFDVADEPVAMYSMPHLKGYDLPKYIKKLQPSFAGRLQIALQITRALAHAHEHSIYHRDVKPANVFITEEGRAYLVDFGIALLEDQTRLTRTSEVVGTLRYMSPETFDGRPFDARSEVYSLGLTLYELFTGQEAFDDSVVLERHVTGASPPVPSEVNKDLPKELDEILAKAMAIKREERYQNCSELIFSMEQMYGYEGKEEESADDRRILSLARMLERIYAEKIHSLKNVFSMVQRYRTKPEKLAARFFSPTTVGRIKILADAALLEEIDYLKKEAGDSLPPVLKEALQGLFALRDHIANMNEHVSRLKEATGAQQRDALLQWHKLLVALGKRVSSALQTLNVSVASVIEDATAIAAGQVQLSVELCDCITVRSVNAEQCKKDLVCVFENLLQNALQANARKIAIKCKLTANETHLSIEVANDGEAISEAIVDKILKTTVTTKAHGTGTGLMACRELLHRHRGTIKLLTSSPVRFQVILDRGRLVGTNVELAESEKE